MQYGSTGAADRLVAVHAQRAFTHNSPHQTLRSQNDVSGVGCFWSTGAPGRITVRPADGDGAADSPHAITSIDNYTNMTKTTTRALPAGIALLTGLSLVLLPTVALADGHTRVVNENTASIMNVIDASANTGDNAAFGSSGGRGGNGGGITNTGNDADDNTGGSGGTGGDATGDGTVTTGAASALVTIDTLANSNRTVIDRCGCGEEEGATSTENGAENHTMEHGNDRVVNRNSAEMMNLGSLQANTGGSVTGGSTGGTGGNGGGISNGSGDADGNTGGRGGNAGMASGSGSVRTGASTALATIISTINTNVTRIRR